MPRANVRGNHTAMRLGRCISGQCRVTDNRIGVGVAMMRILIHNTVFQQIAKPALAHLREVTSS